MAEVSIKKRELMEPPPGGVDGKGGERGHDSSLAE